MKEELIVNSLDIVSYKLWLSDWKKEKIPAAAWKHYKHNKHKFTNIEDQKNEKVNTVLVRVSLPSSGITCVFSREIIMKQI